MNQTIISKKIVAVTGHRPHRFCTGYSIDTFNKLYQIAFDWLSTNSVDYINQGGAIGTDSAFGLAALNLSIPYTVAIPFKGQESRWYPKDKPIYYGLLEKANKVIYVDELPEYTVKGITEANKSGYGIIAAKMQQRNMWLMDNCTEVVTLWDGVKKGGTWNAIRYAQSKGLHITNLWNKF